MSADRPRAVDRDLDQRPLGERLLAVVHPPVEEVSVDLLGLEPLLDELHDLGLVERPAGVDVDADEAVVGRSMDLDAPLDDRDPAAVARLAREGRLAGLEDIRLRLLRHMEVQGDLVEELISPFEVTARRLVAAEAVDDQLEPPRGLVLFALATVLLVHGSLPIPSNVKTVPGYGTMNFIRIRTAIVLVGSTLAVSCQRYRRMHRYLKHTRTTCAIFPAWLASAS